MKTRKWALALASGVGLVLGAIGTAEPASAQAYYGCGYGYYYSPGYGCVPSSPGYGYLYGPPPPAYYAPPAYYYAPPVYDFGLSFGFGGGRGWRGGGDRDRGGGEGDHRR